MEQEIRQKPAPVPIPSQIEAANAWENERAALTAEVARLQHAVGELIERSNNPKRANMSVREDLQDKLNAAIREKERAVSAFLHEKTAWDEEKAQLTAELEQLRMASAKSPRGRLPVDVRTRELESRIATMQKELDLIRASTKLQIQKLERQISESRQSVDTEANRIRQLTADITKQISDPATELSTVIRKNVELAELNAYVKGIQFSQGNGKSR